MARKGQGKPKDLRGSQHRSRLSCRQRSEVVLKVVAVVVQWSRLRGVHLAVVVRLLANLLLPSERPHGPEAGTMGRPRRGAEKARQVALAVKLILARPKPDR